MLALKVPGQHHSTHRVVALVVSKKGFLKDGL